MPPFLLEENSAIGLVINAFWFIVVAPFYIGILAMVLSGKSRNRERGLVLAVVLIFVGYGAGLMGLLPIPAEPYLFFFCLPLIVGLIRLLKLSGKPPQP
jgi:hypothetical protein